jgi:WD40 repeat protein
VWDSAGRVQDYAPNVSVRWIRISPRGGCSVWNSESRNPTIWDPVSARARCAIEMAHRNPIAAQACSPDGRMLATAGADGEIILWETENLVPQGQLFGDRGGLTAVGYSPDGRTLATGGEDRVVRLWDLATKQELAAFDGHTRGATQICFSSDGLTLASAAPLEGGHYEVIIRRASQATSPADRTPRSTVATNLEKDSDIPR